MKNFEQGKSELKRRIRLFFALWPSRLLQQNLHSLARHHQKQCGGRVMRAESIHLTLLFLGETAVEHIEQLRNAVAEVKVASFELTLDRFAGWRHNGIGFVAPIPSEMLTELAQQLRSSVASAGFSFDERVFTPHMTLLRKMEKGPIEAPITPMSWPIDEFVLVESQPDAAGIRYVIIGRWPLSRPTIG